MSVARLLVLVAAGVAAVFVWLYVRNSSATPEPVEAAVAPVSSAVRVLVSSRDLPLGTRITPGDLRWREWPDGGVSELFVTDRDDPQAIEHHVGSIVRDTLAEGEPIIARKIVAPTETGFMAAILSPGLRAVSAEITADTAAGGFILPGDRVDVILTYETEVASTGDDFQTSRTILENVRVLAIDQSALREDDDQVHVGSTATLELGPAEAETLALAQALGDITLALRSVADIDPDAAAVDGAGRGGRNPFGGVSPTLSVYRYGARTTTPLRGGP